MALLGNINIGDRDSEFTSGVAFSLVKNSKISELFQLSKDAYIEVNPQVNYAVVCFKDTMKSKEVLERGHELVQQGLDFLSVLGKENLTIHDAGTEHLIWWKENGFKILRVVSTSRLNFDVSPVKVLIRDKDGNEVNNHKTEPIYHKSFRFFRLSQLTEDLHDSYRNMYLAFELLLNSKWPKKKNEKEIDWLYRGISGADASLNFSGIVGNCSNVTKYIIKTIYNNARLPLFHAKEKYSFYSPQSLQDKKSVTKALDLLTKIVLKLSASHYNVRRAGGAVALKWVYDNAFKIYSSAKMLISNDDSVFDTANADLSHCRYKNAIWLNTHVFPAVAGSGNGPVILGSIDKNDFGDIKSLNRFQLVHDRNENLITPEII